jgi:BirA family biotin operon repressor/biotin-[acetyl-CoA-carboxylase] ligase
MVTNMSKPHTYTLNVNKIQDSLCTKYFGRNILSSHRVNSTNKWAQQLAVFGAPEGTVVIAETQTTGRGRLNRKWISPSGGLWFSIILRPKLRPADAVKLTFMTGLAVAKILREMFGLRAETKWPNDVLVNRRKICGILTEMNTTGERANFVVVGVGVNANLNVEKVFSEHLRQVATSLENELGREVQLEELCRALLEQIENLYELSTRKGFNVILDEWKSNTGILGRHVELTNLPEKIRGLALNVDHEGALIIRLEDGTVRRVFFGDVSLRT